MLWMGAAAKCILATEKKETKHKSISIAVMSKLSVCLPLESLLYLSARQPFIMEKPTDSTRLFLETVI